ncbi:MAG: hypothetical protein AAF682_30605 [Planctomycetota bacterium]
MIPTLLVVSGMAIFALTILASVLGTKKTSNLQADDYRLSSAVESVAILGAERIWSGYLAEEGGTAGTIASFRTYLTEAGIPDSGPGGPPDAEDGTDLLPMLSLPDDEAGATLQNVAIDAVQVVRRDEGDATQLFLTVSASTNRGAGLVKQPLNRAVQQVYSIEPEDFSGFDFAVLANNVNCIFCHTKVDSVDRVFNTDPALADTFERVKVGTLETLMLRHYGGASGNIGDFDADSFIAGTLYVRGSAVDQNGSPINNWNDLAFQGYEFDPVTGGLLEDAFGAMNSEPFVPAGDPPQPMENLYLDYPDDYADMVDGNLPIGFPAPIPDNGGLDTQTGLPDPDAEGNKIVDDIEFAAAAEDAFGTISGGAITVFEEGNKIDSLNEFGAAMLLGTPGASLADVVDGNLILTGTEDNPIRIDGTVAIDGDVVLTGYIVGEGSLIVRGNVYMPSDVEYLDGKTYLAGDDPGNPTGPRTFGMAQDGTKNALALAAGGNVMIGDYLAPSQLQPDWTWQLPQKYEIVDGSADDSWNFSLAEMSLFNRGEWAKTQELLPGPGGSMVPNPGYVEDYVPRYYHFGDGDEVPIYNKGDIYFDPVAETWHGDSEVPISWDEDLLTIADPNDPNDPYLYPATGPQPALLEITPKDDWLPADIYKVGIEYYEDIRPMGKPLSIDGLIYTNNSIFSIVTRSTPMFGQMTVNGSIVAADLGMLVPGFKDPWGFFSNKSELSDYAVGLQLNYDQRVKGMIQIDNPYQVQLKRKLWNPTANLL